MFVVGNFLIALSKMIDVILFFFYWVILLRAIISWVNPDPYNGVVQFLNRTSEPILQPIRRILPPGRIDFSPIAAFIIIIFLQSFLVASIAELGYRMKSNPGTIEIPIQKFESRPIAGDQMIH